MSIGAVKRLFISLIGFVFILFIFGSVTFAWVSMARINNLDGLSLTASSGNELEISFDGIIYQSTLGSEHFREPIYLKDVTTLDGYHFQRGPTHLGANAILNEDYLSFDLYFRSLRSEKGIYVINDGDTGTKITSEGVTFVPKVDYIEDNFELVLAQSIRTYYAKDASRMSFHELDDENEIIRSLIYDPSGNERRGFGKPYGAHSYFEKRTSQEVPLPEEVPQTIYQLSTMDPFNPYQALNNDSLIAVMKESEMENEEGDMYYTAKVRIFIWIEGWDADAIDGILDDHIMVQLKFKLAQLA